MLHGMPYILCQLEFSMLLSDYFCMSFQSGVVFCSSHETRGFPCQDTTNQMPELDFRVYHRTYQRRPRRAINRRMRAMTMREKMRAFMTFVSLPCGGGCTWENQVVR